MADDEPRAAIDDELRLVADVAAQTGNPRMMRAVETLASKLRDERITDFGAAVPPE